MYNIIYIVVSIYRYVCVTLYTPPSIDAHDGFCPDRRESRKGGRGGRERGKKGELICLWRWRGKPKTLNITYELYVIHL